MLKPPSGHQFSPRRRTISHSGSLRLERDQDVPFLIGKTRRSSADAHTLRVKKFWRFLSIFLTAAQARVIVEQILFKPLLLASRPCEGHSGSLLAGSGIATRTSLIATKVKKFWHPVLATLRPNGVASVAASEAHCAGGAYVRSLHPSCVAAPSLPAASRSQPATHLAANVRSQPAASVRPTSQRACAASQATRSQRAAACRLLTRERALTVRMQHASERATLHYLPCLRELHQLARLVRRVSRTRSQVMRQPH